MLFISSYYYISILAKPLDPTSGVNSEHPFYPLRDFKLRHQEPLEFPESLLVSSNYFNPTWTGEIDS